MAGFSAVECGHQPQCLADTTCRVGHRPGLQLSPKDLSFTSRCQCCEPCVASPVARCPSYDSCAWVVSDCGCCDGPRCPPVVRRLTCVRRGSPSIPDDQTHRPKWCPGPCGCPTKGRRMGAINRARASLRTIRWGRDRRGESSRTPTKPNLTRHAARSDFE